MTSQSSLSFLSLNFTVWPNSSTLSFSPDSLFFTWSILLVRLSTEFCFSLLIFPFSTSFQFGFSSGSLSFHWILFSNLGLTFLPYSALPICPFISFISIFGVTIFSEKKRSYLLSNELKTTLPKVHSVLSLPNSGFQFSDILYFFFFKSVLYEWVHLPSHSCPYSYLKFMPYLFPQSLSSLIGFGNRPWVLATSVSKSYPTVPVFIILLSEESIIVHILLVIYRYLCILFYVALDFLFVNHFFSIVIYF